jgi:hypothetical protein
MDTPQKTFKMSGFEVGLVGFLGGGSMIIGKLSSISPIKNRTCGCKYLMNFQCEDAFLESSWFCLVLIMGLVLTLPWLAFRVFLVLVG